MSLMGTLAKVAIGVAVVKGAGALMQGRQNQQGTTGEGGLFGGAHSPGQAQTSGGGGLEEMLGGLLGGGAQGGASQGGGLGGLLESLGGGQAQGGGASGGFDDMLRNATQGGGLGDLLGGLGGAAASRNSGNGGNNNADAGSSNNKSESFGKVLNQSLNRRGEPEAAPTQDQEAAAGLMLRAMIQAAKSDGKIDDGERDKLLGKLGDISAAEREFVSREMQAPVDVAGLARQVPSGLEQQVYAMSVLGIDLDSQAEAQYLHQLATAMNLNQQQVNYIHDQLGVRKIYQ